MKLTSVSILCGVIAFTAGLSAAQSQQAAAITPPPSSSLGELARKLKVQREKSPAKPQTVYTNDNMPVRPQEEGATAATGMAPAESRATKTEAAGTKETKAEPASTSPSAAAGVRDEKYYRTKMKELQAQLELHKRELNVLQQKSSQNQMQYYSDPQKTLNQEFSRSDVNKLVSDIDKKKQQIAEDEAAIDALRDQLRRDAGDPGWLR
jgi:hypothetical protein